MIESPYNFWLEKDDKHLCFNSLTCGFVEIDNEKYEFIKNYLDTNNCTDLNSEKIDIINQLKHARILVESTTNDLDFLHYNYLRVNHGAKFKGFTILPTLKCNFNCSYCFEQNKNITMNDDVAAKIEEIVKAAISDKTTSMLSINWFGGEPLLEFDRISQLSEIFINECNKNNIGYEASMISNGWFLTKNVAKKLQEYKLSSVQVTLDGPKMLHNKKRMLKGGQGTFDTIIERIIEASEYLNIIVRVNIDKEFCNLFDEFFEDIKPLRGNQKISLYPSKIMEDSTAACKSYESNCIKVKDFAKAFVDFQKMLIKNGFGLRWGPSPRPGGCGATCPSSMVICPDGSLYRCWSQVGELGESYGNIMDIQNTFNPTNYYKWVVFNPLTIEECKNCNLLPICLTGCPATRIPATTDYMKHSYLREDKCTLEKYSISDLLLLLYDEYKKLNNTTVK